MAVKGMNEPGFGPNFGFHPDDMTFVFKLAKQFGFDEFLGVEFHPGIELHNVHEQRRVQLRPAYNWKNNNLTPDELAVWNSLTRDEQIESGAPEVIAGHFNLVSPGDSSQQ